MTTWLALLTLLLPATSLAGAPRASSEHRDSDGARHPASQAFDGLLSTAWAEGELGDGEGAWLELKLDGPTDVRSVSIWPGNLSGGQRTIRETGRPKRVKVTLSGAGDEVTVDKPLLDPAEHGMLRVDVDIEGRARTIRIEVEEAYRGGIYSDLFIAEVAVNFVSGDPPAQAQRLAAWLESDAGAKAVEANREEVIALYDRVNGEEFGDRDALLQLMDRAADGAPFLRSRVQSQIPAGFRMSALPADDVAVEALLKIKDSNAIPAVDRAAVRSQGPLAARYRQLADAFRAHQELVGGGRRNIAPYGDTGWEPGAFQSLGEPLPIEIDSLGRLWIADVGNHRVQRLGAEGLFQKAWGVAEPGVTTAWLGGNRAPYAAGSAPAEAPRGFTSPLDVAILTHKKGDVVAVLDGRGQIALIDAADQVTASWMVPFDVPVTSGVGGEAHLTWVKGKLVVAWGTQGFVYDAEGAELARFDIADGSPTGALPVGGKVGFIHGRALVLYSLDGFRHGDVMGQALGEGFEAWSAAWDERGRLWAVTDKGQLFRLKKPGKVDFVVSLGDTVVELPRIDVHDDRAYVTLRDRVQVFDALELHAKAKLAAKEAP